MQSRGLAATTRQAHMPDSTLISDLLAVSDCAAVSQRECETREPATTDVSRSDGDANHVRERERREDVP